MVRTPLIPTRPSESRETSHVTVVWTVALTPGRVRKPLASVLMERLTQLSPFGGEVRCCCFGCACGGLGHCSCEGG